MGRSKKSKASKVANFGKNRKSGSDKCSNINERSNEGYVSKTKKASADEFKVTKEKVDKLIVIDESTSTKKIPSKQIRGNNSCLTKNMTEEKCKPSISHNRVNSQDEKICVMGNFNQGNIERYGYYAGKQCVPNSLLCIIYRKIVNLRLWNSYILDKILDLGNEYYQYLQTLPNIHNDYIMVNELIKTVEVEGKYFDLQISDEPGVGIIDTNNYVAVGLFESLQTCLNTYESCFITFNNNTFAIMKQDDSYFVFDPHSRDRFGLITPDGVSVLLEYNDINDLYLHCLNLCVAMNLNRLEQYEITGINVVMLNDESNDNANEVYCESMQIDEDNEISQLISDGTDDVVITNVNCNEFLFDPIRMEKRRKLCQLINLPIDKLNYVDVDNCVLKKPSVIKEIQGDDER